MTATKTKPEARALEIAARLWPSPDPVNRMKCEAFRHLLNLDSALHRAIPLRSAAAQIARREFERLWIQPTKLEGLLSALHAELQAAAKHTAEALYLLSEARQENDVRNIQQCSQERAEKTDE